MSAKGCELRAKGGKGGGANKGGVRGSAPCNNDWRGRGTNPGAHKNRRGLAPGPGAILSSYKKVGAQSLLHMAGLDSTEEGA
jgi:hypothetical protein